MLLASALSPAARAGWDISVRFGTPHRDSWQSRWHHDHYWNPPVRVEYDPWPRHHWHHQHSYRFGTPDIYVAPAPVIVSPPVVIEQPPVYITPEPAPAPIVVAPVVPRRPTAEDPTLYYCASENAYYPSVRSCGSGWVRQVGTRAQ